MTQEIKDPTPKYWRYLAFGALGVVTLGFLVLIGVSSLEVANNYKKLQEEVSSDSKPVLSGLPVPSTSKNPTSTVKQPPDDLKEPTPKAKFVLDASMEIAKALTSSLGTIATIAGGIVLYLNFKVANRTADLTEKNIELTREKLDQDAQKAIKDAELAESRLTTERFSKGIEQLGDIKLEIQLGAIYSLERIAKDSPKYLWTVIEVLSAFVRQKALMNSKNLLEIRENIRGALTVIGGLNTEEFSQEKFREIDLTQCKFYGINLFDTNLSKALLIGSRLDQCIFLRGNFSEAYFSSSNCSGSSFPNGNFSKANLNNINFSKANLYNAEFSNANLYKANFSEAGLSNTNFSEANLYEAIFFKTNFTNTIFAESDIDEALFIDITGLDVDQIKKAKNYETAYYDPEFREELGLPPDTRELPQSFIDFAEHYE